MADLSTQIALFDGHAVPADGSSPIWTGTVRDFLSSNVEQAEGEELDALIENIGASGRHRIGGGAAQAFILLRIDPVDQLAAVARVESTWPREGVVDVLEEEGHGEC